MSHPVSQPLQPGIRFFQHPISARQSRLVGISLPKGQRDRVPTFRIVDPMDDLGAPSTTVVRSRFSGMVRQFRVPP